MRAVVGWVPDAQAATLAGFRRGMLRGETYPGLVPGAGHSTLGVLYSGLREADWRALDAYESEEYARVRVELVAASGERLAALVYLIPEPLRHRVSEVPWDRERFERLHMDALLGSRPTSGQR